MTAPHGSHSSADLLTRLADGTDLNYVWNEYITLLNAVNDERQAIISFLSFPVTNPVETVVNPGPGIDFEIASEFGEPVGRRIKPSVFQMGYTFKWYDLASRYTWMFLAEASRDQVDSIANAAVEAHLRLQMTEVMKTIFNPTNLAATIDGLAYTVYKFYNNDGTVPPPVKTTTFAGTHQHYVTSGATTVDPGDLQVFLDDFASHGYDNVLGGYKIVLMVNKTQGDTIRTFRAGTANSLYDFIPSVGQPGQIVTFDPRTELLGATRPANTLQGLNVIGSWGNMLIVQDSWIPSGYMLGFVTGGKDNISNPVGYRQHAQSSLRGLKLVKGRNADYPLIDSFWTLGFGTGIRHRGAGIVMQITASGSYTTPSEFV